MIEINFLAIFVAAFIPLIMGFIWYNPKVVGSAWMKETGLNEEKLKEANMGLIFFLSFVFSFFIAGVLLMVTVHQFGALGMVGGKATLAKPSFTEFMNDYGMAFRSFGHGALHSSMTAIFLVFPIIAINALFERRSWRYIFIHTGFWLICITIMGGIVCGWYDLGHFNLITPK